MHFKEIETKYEVPNLKLTEFNALCQSLTPVKYIEAAGYDYYFTSPSDPSDFMRYRAGDRQELTRKRKTKLANNYVRDEWNLLLAHGQPLSKIAGFCSSLGFPKLNFCIFKACFIYYFEKFDLVYYVVYDEDMKEVNRFLEIEMLEDYPWQSEEQAWQELENVETSLTSLGINSKNRVSESLFEMFRK
jgi:adenylate cyclase class IV